MSVTIKRIFCIICFICFSISQESYPEKLPTKHLNKHQQYKIRYLSNIRDGLHRINEDIISKSIKLKFDKNYDLYLLRYKLEKNDIFRIVFSLYFVVYHVSSNDVDVCFTLLVF